MNQPVHPSAPQGKSRQINRAEVVDGNFLRAIAAHAPDRRKADALRTSSLTSSGLLELFESMLVSRHLDLMARVLRVQNKVYYTIGSSGHEGNALVGRLTRHSDPALLHYRSGGFMAERSRKLPGIDPVVDSALSFAASAADPASGGRHKVWGSKPLWVLPQTSTIASHLPKAFGLALAIEAAPRFGHPLPIPGDAIVVCSFGDASLNHSTALGALNAAGSTAWQGLKVPVLFVCEDNGIGISVRTPAHWTQAVLKSRPGLDYFYADGLDVVAGHDAVAAAVAHCRSTRRPTLLHLKTVRLMGHAGTDFEVEYRGLAEIEAAEAADPLLACARTLIDAGILSGDEVLARYEAMRRRCFAAAEAADALPKLSSLEEVARPLAPLHLEEVMAEARRFVPEASCKDQPVAPRHLALQINQGLAEILKKYGSSLLFGEDVAQKGGVYTVTKGLHKEFKAHRVFNTLLDEQTILGIAQGYGTLGYLPIPEIQYLAYFHNACDQIRGEACSLQFFSNGQFRNPLLMRIAGLGYQKGFGGHFHNDNSLAALRDIPSLIVGCPSRGDDAVAMLRTMAALCQVDGRVCAFVEPIALYMTRDLHAPGDGQWLFPYPAQGQALVPGEPRIYAPEARDLAIVTFGNAVPMALRAARRLGEQRVRVIDLRWLAPLASEAIVAAVRDCAAVLVVDEGRSAGVGEGVITALVEAGLSDRPIRRVVGADCYTPLAGAAGFVLPSDDSVLAAAAALLQSDR